MASFLLIIFSLLLSLLFAGLHLFLFKTLGQLINTFLEGYANSNQQLNLSILSNSLLYFSFQVGGLFLYVLLGLIKSFVNQKIIMQQTLRMQNKYLRNIQELKRSEVDRCYPQNRLSTILLDTVEGYTKVRVGSFLDIADKFILLVVFFIFLVFIHWMVALLVFGITLILSFSTKILAKVTNRNRTALQKNNQQFKATIKEYLNALKLLVFYKKEKLLVEKTKEINHSNSQTTEKLNLLEKIRSNLTTNLLFLATDSIVFVLLFFSIKNYFFITSGEVFAVFVLINHLLRSLKGIYLRLGQLISQKSLKKEVHIDLPREKGEILIFNAAPLIKATNLCYSTDSGQEIIKNFNAVFLPNKKYGIVGPSGVGKSTLLKLISGEIRNYQGSLKINGIEASKIKDSNLRALYSFCSSENALLLDNSTMDNVAFFSSEVRALQSLEQVNLINELGESGVNQILAKTLSEGQKQRVCLARAFSQDKFVFLIDEGLAHLDSNNVENVKSLIQKNKKATYIIVSHHFKHEDKKFFDEIIKLAK